MAKVVRAAIMGWVDLIVGVARKAERELGGIGPFTPEEIGAFVANAFIGAESLYLLGIEKKGSPVRQALAADRRSHSHAPRASKSNEVTSCVQSCPTRNGFVERDGVKLYYEVYGEGPETMVFLPPWSIVHSRIYKAQLPYFSERFRCITYDGRGNGKSDRPAEVAAYSLDNTWRMRSPSWMPPMRDRRDPRRPFLWRHARLHAGRASSRTRQGRHPGRHRGEHRARAIPTWRQRISSPSANSSRAGTSTTASTG